MARILVIADEPRMRDLLHSVLRQKGHETALAESGSTGVERFRAERPDVTILDLHLPHLNGLAVLTQVRSIDPHARVIVLTGVGTETAEQQARVLGVSEVLRKGFSLHALSETLNRVLNQPGPQA